jgi:hypothetical protein
MFCSSVKLLIILAGESSAATVAVVSHRSWRVGCIATHLVGVSSLWVASRINNLLLFDEVSVNWKYYYTGCIKNAPVSSWGPGSKQEIALVNLVPRSVTGTFFCPLSTSSNVLHKAERILWNFEKKNKRIIKIYRSQFLFCSELDVFVKFIFCVEKFQKSEKNIKSMFTMDTVLLI